MNPASAPEIRLLVDRWCLPAERVDDVLALLRSQDEGGTAWPLTPGTPAAPAAWGLAARPAGEAAPTPLVLRTFGDTTYLQAWRSDLAEGAIARDLIARSHRAATPAGPPAADRPRLLEEENLNAEQRRAVETALAGNLTLITGGPGTGKTHTLARLLALFLSRPGPPPVLRLAAPTGKAADRMRAAVQAAAAGFGPAFEPLRDALSGLAAEASTLHHLLGYNPGTGRCRHDASRPLRCDALIIDECSMVDTWLWRALLAALPPECRLVLVGDPNQLESVEAGDVLGSLVRPGPDGSPSPLEPVRVELVESRRFRNRAGIGHLARAVVERRSEDAVALLRAHDPAADPGDGLLWLGDRPAHPDAALLPAAVLAALTRLADAPGPEAALAALERVRVLTAHRDGPWGVAGLNRALRAHFLRRPGIARPPNEPIIINRNDPGTHLSNGSVGLLLPGPDGPRAWFAADQPGAAPRAFSPAELPDHEPAWALTVHRAQGSEFDHVVVVLPPAASRLATGELVYTALTRAKDCVHVWGGEADLRAALATRPGRRTLLAARLREAAARWPSAE